SHHPFGAGTKREPRRAFSRGLPEPGKRAWQSEHLRPQRSGRLDAGPARAVGGNARRVEANHRRDEVKQSLNRSRRGSETLISLHVEEVMSLGTWAAERLE